MIPRVTLFIHDTLDPSKLFCHYRFTPLGSSLSPELTVVDMPFQFIDNNTILDNTKRKLIRSHAALGRNKGKRLSRPSRKSASRATSTRFYTPNIVQKTSQSTGFREIERPINDGLVFPGLLPGETNGIVKNGLFAAIILSIIYPLRARNGFCHCSNVRFSVIAFMSTIRYSPELDDGLDYSDLATPICVQYMFIDEACKFCLPSRLSLIE